MPDLGDFFGYAKVSGTVVAGSATAVTVLPANSRRTRVIFSNKSGGAWFIKFGGTATIGDYSVVVAGDSNYVHNAPIHSGTFSAIQAVATGSLMVTEFSTAERNW